MHSIHMPQHQPDICGGAETWPVSSCFKQDVEVIHLLVLYSDITISNQISMDLSQKSGSLFFQHRSEYSDSDKILNSYIYIPNSITHKKSKK